MKNQYVINGVRFVRQGRQFIAERKSERGPCVATLRGLGSKGWSVELGYPDGSFIGEARTRELAYRRASVAAWVRR